MPLRLLTTSVIMALGLAVIPCGPGQSQDDPYENYEPPDPDPCGSDVEDALAEYQSGVKACLEDASDLSEAKECWKED